MKQNYTHITFVVDRSGSMSSCWPDVVGGYSSFVAKNQAQDGDCSFSLVAFDTEYTVPVDFQPIGQVSANIGVEPRGCTALLDAVGKAITQTRERINALAEAERPEKVLFVIQTDGMENASKEFTNETLKSAITAREGDGWEFMFLGAGKEFLNQAASMGIKSANTAHYDPKNMGQTMNMVTNKAMAYRSADCLVSGEAAVSFSDDERNELVE